MKKKPKAKPVSRSRSGKRSPAKKPAASRKKFTAAIRKIRADLPKDGRQLLELVVSLIHTEGFDVDDPRTYLGYKECCEYLGLISHPDMNVRWGRLLATNGMASLNEWVARQKLPALTGLIVNKDENSDRYCQPGGDYFDSNGRPDLDMNWWKEQVKAAVAFNWQQFL